jgi:hypothetical protein
MKVQYQKGKNKRFMILDGNNYPENFETEMMKENNISALLPFYTVEKNGRIQYWYDITGKRSLEEYFMQEGISMEVIYTVFLYIKAAIEEIQEYLINEENILMQPDTVFIKKETDDGVGLCFFPHNNNSVSALPIGEYLINTVDHKDKEVTFFCYKLYEKIQEPGFMYSDLISEIKRELDKTESIEDKIVQNVYKDEQIIQKKEIADYCKSECISECRDNIKIKDDRHENELNKTDIDSISKADMAKNKNLYIGKVINAGTEKLTQTMSAVKDKTCELFPFLEDVLGRKTITQNESLVGRLIYEGNSGEKDYCIDQEIFKIGKDKKHSDAILHSMEISKRQSVIERKNGHFYLKDMNSKKGTYHNGRKLERGEYIKLEELDTISFADVPYRFA